MEEMKHTPEPWRVDVNAAHNVNMIVSSSCDAVGKSHIAQVLTANPYKVPQEVQDANAARIVACVNHCKGATNKELELTSHEQLVQRFENEARDLGIAENEIRQLKAQRDELLQALMELLSLINYDYKNYRGNCKTLSEAEELAFKAIQKATGEL